MIVEILTLGDELLDGRRVDTNTAWLGRKFTSLGTPPRYRQTVSDRTGDIEAAFRLALARSDFIVSTGGLGPTADDVTFEALAGALGRKLEFHEEIFRKVVERFKKRGIHCPDSNRRQALLPGGAREIPNELGTAPAIRVDVDDKVVFCLPGVPAEMMPLFEKGVEPEFLARIQNRGRRSEKIYKFVGLPESHVEEAVNRCNLDRIADADVRIAYTASFPWIDVTLSVGGKTPDTLDRILEEADAAIRRELGEYLAAEGSETLESRAVAALKERGWTLAVAESMTGGLLAGQIVNVPGSSEVFLQGVVAYSNESKVKTLQVSEKTLTEFGAVSGECALEMAKGARQLTGADVAVSTTGIAGPAGGTEAKPVGLTFIAWVGPDFEKVRRYQFRWDRNRNRMLAVCEALKGLTGLIRGKNGPDRKG